MGIVGYEIAKKVIERYNPESVLFCPYKEEMWDCTSLLRIHFQGSGEFRQSLWQDLRRLEYNRS